MAGVRADVMAGVVTGILEDSRVLEDADRAGNASAVGEGM